jgi:hypothetical protein
MEKRSLDMPTLVSRAETGRGNNWSNWPAAIAAKQSADDRTPINRIPGR